MFNVTVEHAMLLYQSEAQPSHLCRDLGARLNSFTWPKPTLTIQPVKGKNVQRDS